MQEQIFGRRDAVLVAIDQLEATKWNGVDALRKAVECLREGGEASVYMRKYRIWPFFGKLYQEIRVDDSARCRCYYNSQLAPTK